MGNTTLLNSGQMRLIYTLARTGGLDNDMLHDLVRNMTRKESIKKLTSIDAKQVIDYLKRINGEEVTSAHDRSTAAQINKINSLAVKLGWSSDPHRLRAWLEKRYKVSHPRFLDEKSSRNCIEAMKAMLVGGRGEMKGGSNDKLVRKAGT